MERSGNLGGKSIFKSAASGGKNDRGFAASSADSGGEEDAGDGPQGDPPDEGSYDISFPKQGETQPNTGEHVSHIRGIKAAPKQGETQPITGEHDSHIRGTKTAFFPSFWRNLFGGKRPEIKPNLPGVNILSDTDKRAFGIFVPDALLDHNIASMDMVFVGKFARPRPNIDANLSYANGFFRVKLLLQQWPKGLFHSDSLVWRTSLMCSVVDRG